MVEGLLNLCHNAPSSGHFDKLANPVRLGIKNSDRGLFSTVYPAPQRDVNAIQFKGRRDDSMDGRMDWMSGCIR